MKRIATACVHGGVEPDPTTGAILAPIYQSTTFVQESVEKYLEKGFSYSRSDNPTVRMLENKISVLEEGVDSVCFATGMAATCTIFSAFLSPGDHCLVTSCSYGGTNRAAKQHFAHKGIDFEFIDMRNPKVVEQRIKPMKTKLIFSESPTNPTLFLADVAEISKISKRHGVLHVCDSTFATPVIMKALKLGADMALVSTTKFYDGHNLTVGGVVVSSTLELDQKVRWTRNVLGNIQSPQNAFYQLQCAKTLVIRVERQSAAAQYLAEFLESHPKVETVVYPGLRSFPQRELADRQHENQMHGCMLWFEVVGGTPAGIRLMNNIRKPWSLCENLGTVESIITCPAVFTHAAMSAEDRAAVGISDGFVRVSVGIEDAEDLKAALAAALDAV